MVFIKIFITNAYIVLAKIDSMRALKRFYEACEFLGGKIEEKKEGDKWEVWCKITPTLKMVLYPTKGNALEILGEGKDISFSSCLFLGDIVPEKGDCITIFGTRGTLPEKAAKVRVCKTWLRTPSEEVLTFISPPFHIDVKK